jgi:flagellar hook-length control protein FliK
MEKEDFLSEQVTKQIAAKEISVSSAKTVEIQVEKLPEELPNIIKAKLQQSETKEGSRDFIIQLEPKALGKMSVKLTSMEGIVSVKILVEQVESKSIIDNSIQNLKQNFLDQGIKYGRIDVEVGSQFAGQDNQQQQQNLFFNEQANRRNYMKEGDYYTDIETNQATGMMISSSNVDYLA